MPELNFTPLPDRALIALRGEDRGSFLQGLVSNDIRRVEAGLAAWAAFLTPQGKFLHEFFMFGLGNGIWLDCERARRGDLIERLSRYKLRAKVSLEANDDLTLGAAWGRHVNAAFGMGADLGQIKPLGAGVVYTDPRLADAGVRWALLNENAHVVLRELGWPVQSAATLPSVPRHTGSNRARARGPRAAPTAGASDHAPGHRSR